MAMSVPVDTLCASAIFSQLSPETTLYVFPLKQAGAVYAGAMMEMLVRLTARAGIAVGYEYLQVVCMEAQTAARVPS